MVRLITKPQMPREVLNMYVILKFCSIGALIETYSVLNCFKVIVRLNNIVCSCSSPKHFWSLLLIVLTLKAHSKAIIFVIYILTLTVIKPILKKRFARPEIKAPHLRLRSVHSPFNFTISVIDICVFDTTVLISDEPDGQKERQLQYLDQEKFSYITNYLEQTRDTDVHSLSTEDDSGKPGSINTSAPSEFGFEETSGKTQSIPRAPNPSPQSICQLARSQGGGHLSSRV